MAKVNTVKDLLSNFPNATLTAKANVSRHQPDSLDEARAKVIKKAVAAKGDILVNGCIKNDSILNYDPSTGTYAVGLKYGNRWLKNVFDEDLPYVKDITGEQKDELIDGLVKLTENGLFDEQIEEIRQANRYSRRTNPQR